MSRIVVGTDTSAAADMAVDTAADLARARDAELVVVFVKTPQGDRAAFDPDRAVDPAAYLGRMPGRFPGLRVRTREETGDPAERICAVAGEEEADVIVVGNRGVHGRLHTFLRSVPGGVVRRAGSSVLVVDTRNRQ